MRRWGIDSQLTRLLTEEPPYSSLILRVQSSPASPWALKLGIRRELGLYADSIARRGAHYFFYAWELPVRRCRLSLLSSET